MKTHYLEGTSALSWLRDTHWQARWMTLFEACPWATSFQSTSYVLQWFEAYAESCLPIVVYSSEENSLRGLLVLALDRETRALVVAGAHQAEYKSWLCLPGESPSFLKAAIGTLGERFPGKSLRFLYFPDSREVASISKPSSNLSSHLFVREHSRPLLSIADGSSIEASLRKKSNKSKINRLKRRGELTLRILESRRELEADIDEIAALYDLRQSAANGVAPFFEDPCKREFHLRLMEAGLMHCATLSVNGEIIAALLSVPNQKTLAVGVFAISARLATESPGKILLLLLARCLVTEGVVEIDLTPGGAWKDRFANCFDTVHELIFYFDSRQAIAERRKQKATNIAKRCLASIGLTPSDVRQWSTVMSPSALKAWPRQLWTTRVHTLFVLSVEPTRHSKAPSDASTCGVSWITYPKLKAQKEFYALMSESFRRLETGWHCYARKDQGHLNKLIWLSPSNGRGGIEIGELWIPVSQDSWLADLTMHRRFTSLAAPDKSDIMASVRAVESSDRSLRMYAFVEQADEATAHELRMVGFQPVTRIILSRRLGRAHQTNTDISAEVVH